MLKKEKEEDVIEKKVKLEVLPKEEDNPSL